MAIPSKQEQWSKRCGPVDEVSTTSSHGQPKSKFLPVLTSVSVASCVTQHLHLAASSVVTYEGGSLPASGWPRAGARVRFLRRGSYRASGRV